MSQALSTKDGEPANLLLGTLRNGRQVLVTVWQDGSGEITFRDDLGRWEPPIPLVKLEER